MLGTTVQIMEFPKVISLTTPQGERAGMMLLAPRAESSSGECVFMLSSASSLAIDSPLGVVISELKVSGEHRFAADTIDSGISLVVFPNGLPQVQFRLDYGFSGQVFTEFDGAITCIGSAHPLPRSA